MSDEQLPSVDSETVETVADDEISQEQKFLLWVAAGARCAFCGKHLLKNEVTGDPVRIGEMAHIVGRIESSRSPRGLDPLPVPKRNLAENLILACANEHTTIDKTSGQAIWETDDLRRLKREHEAHIESLTGMRRDRNTTVLRVGGTIRGTATSMSRSAIHEAVHAELRFPQYHLGPVGADVEVDLMANLDEDDTDYFAETAKILAKRIAGHVGDQIATGEVGHLSVFAFGRIPVLVQLGHHLDDKWPVSLHQYDRVASSWKWHSDEAPVSFVWEKLLEDPGSHQVTLVCALSGSPDMAALPEHCRDGAIYRLRPETQDRGTGLIRTPESLAAFADTYLSFLAALEELHPSAEVLDVIPAVGQSAAIELGRRRTRHKHPRLRIWDLMPDNSYAFAAEVGP